jgi:hypothetical protein
VSDETRDEQTVHNDGFDVTFYPAFASRVEITDADGTVHEIFKQSKPYQLPHGQTKPRSHHKLRLKGGSRKQDITLDIRDPGLRIARITVELYGEDYHDDGRERSVFQTMNVPNDPTVCPPHCS